MKLIIERLDGDAPVQAFGTVNGYAWYFRARGHSCSFALCFQQKQSFDHAIAIMALGGNGLVISKRVKDAVDLPLSTIETLIHQYARAGLAYLNKN